MSKKLYHIPLRKTIRFIEDNKTTLNKYIVDSSLLEYHKLLGKSYWILEIESFIKFFRIDRDINYTLNSIEYFNSKIFFDRIYEHLNFFKFDSNQKDIEKKDFIYAFFYLIYSSDLELFKSLTHQILLHYHTTFNQNTKIYIDYKEMVKSILKRDNKSIKESFGIDKNGVFFSIFIDNELIINQKGKSIKTLRKNIYKKVLFLII